MATTIFQSSQNLHLNGSQSFGPVNVALNNAFLEVVLTVNMSLAELQDSTLSFTAEFQLSKDGGLTWMTTDSMDWQGDPQPDRHGTWTSPALGFDANTLALYEGNQMQVVVNTPNRITCQVVIVGQVAGQ